MFDYIEWRGDLTFVQSPFNPVDNIIFSQLAYIPLDGIVPGPDEKKDLSLSLAAGQFAKKLRESPEAYRNLLISGEDPDFIKALGSAARYQSCRLSAYVNHIDILAEKQFSALCIKLGDNTAYLAFRGTDSSLVGWKEDLNMSFSRTVPSQIEAVSYLESIAKKIRGGLRLGGHSKGGNLAVYAASFCKKRIRPRIIEIYSNDAPGFHQSVITSKGYQAVKDRILTFIPQSSVIGMLFEHDGSYTVVESSQKGLMQHNLYSWKLRRNDLVRLDRVTRGSRFIDKTLREWIDGLDYKQRQQFIEAVYTIFSATEALSIQELSADWLKNSFLVIQTLTNTDDQTKEMIGKVLASLLRAAKNNIKALLPKRGKNITTQSAVFVVP
ncbi:MAG: DUF2974 domain-containing protein [Treponema sp.]|nr:DUF2974 domain-containing protein [Treponema sp.]